MGVEAAMRYLFSPCSLVASCWAPASGCFPDSRAPRLCLSLVGAAVGGTGARPAFIVGSPCDRLRTTMVDAEWSSSSRRRNNGCFRVLRWGSTTSVFVCVCIISIPTHFFCRILATPGISDDKNIPVSCFSAPSLSSSSSLSLSSASCTDQGSSHLAPHLSWAPVPGRGASPLHPDSQPVFSAPVAHSLCHCSPPPHCI